MSYASIACHAFFRSMPWGSIRPPKPSASPRPSAPGGRPVAPQGRGAGAFRRHRQQRGRRAVRARPGAERVLGLFMPERDCSCRQPRAGPPAGRAPGDRDGPGGRHRHARSRRLLPPPRRGHPQRVARVRAGLQVEDRAARTCSTATRYRVFSVVVQSPGGRDAPRAAAAGGLSASRGRHELQAARPQDDGVLPRRPAALRRGRARPTGWSTTRASSSRTATARPTSSRSPTSTRPRSTDWPSTWGSPTIIRSRPPTTDTYSLAQSQEEFFFSLPYDKLDLACTPATTKSPARKPPRPWE